LRCISGRVIEMVRNKKVVERVRGVKVKIDELEDVKLPLYDEKHNKLGEFSLKELKEKGIL